MKKLYLVLFFLLFFATAAFAKININTATAQELTALPGIGQAKAEALVQHRVANGPFKTVDELNDVKGIGNKILENIKNEVTVDK